MLSNLRLRSCSNSVPSTPTVFSKSNVCMILKWNSKLQVEEVEFDTQLINCTTGCRTTIWLLCLIIFLNEKKDDYDVINHINSVIFILLELPSLHNKPLYLNCLKLYTDIQQISTLTKTSFLLYPTMGLRKSKQSLNPLI